MIIKSLLDNDLYKFTMQNAVFHQFTNTQVEYEFKCRNTGINLNNIEKELKEEINNIGDLSFNQEELKYLKSLGFLKDSYIDFLSYFKLEPSNVNVIKNKNLQIKIKGPWIRTILWETPLLAIINELYFKTINKEQEYIEGYKKLSSKIKKIKEMNKLNLNFKFADFGTRRRFSKEWHDKVIEKLINNIPENFVGTSNVYLAKKYGIKCIGTQAHEWFMAHQNLGYRLIDSQKAALQNWANEYRGELGIALSDSLGTNAFLKDFDLYFAKLFDGIRHDSGDPYEWTEKIIKHYNELKINPKNKTAIYSDGLNIDKAIDIYKRFNSMINCSFGIGTNLTNDLIKKPINIVIKMTKCNNKSVAKISDSTGKQLCKDKTYLNYLKKIFNIEKK